MATFKQQQENKIEIKTAMKDVTKKKKKNLIVHKSIQLQPRQ